MNKQKQKQEAIQDGFSSDQQFRQQEIVVENPKVTEPEQIIKEQVKFKIPPPQEIKSKSYSLNPDIAMGWAPKSQLPVPIPLIFEHKRLDCMIKRLWQNKSEKMNICYLGPRFQNTFYSWFEKPFNFPYAHIKAPTNMKFSNRLFSGQNPEQQNGLIFDSFFESANLDCAVRVGQREYDLYIRVDSNTRGHLQWFNFKIRNLQKLQKYKINICNFQKAKSLYSRGMKPFVLSARKYQRQKIGWQQCGDSIRYEQKLGKSAKVLNLESSASFKLRFQYYTQYDDDQVQMAYCIPYTYTQLQSFILQLEKKNQNKEIMSISKLCTSLGGLEVPLLIVHENVEKKQGVIDGDSEIKKKCVVVSGRAHPGESNGSYMMQGFLEFICGNSQQAKNLRTNFIFKIVPMLNPDGVVLGNYRTGISGRDFNRQYRNPQKCIFPEVFAFKRLVTENKTVYNENLLMFLDFHGHSTKKNVFMYGPQFPIIQKHYYECRIFPKILSNITNMFRYYSCTFKVSQFKQTTARAVLLRKLMIPFSYTIQASNGAFYDHCILKDKPFNEDMWVDMGRKIGKGLAEYGEMIVSSQKNRVEKRRERLRKKQIKRTVSKNKSNNNNSDYFNIENTVNSSDNQKIQKLYEEIKNAQEQREFMKNQQDCISQGSSDGEGQKDDLTPQKLKFLFKIIKNKKISSGEKLSKKFAIEEQYRHFKTNQVEEDNNNDNQISKNIKLQKQEQIQDSTVFLPVTNIRGQFPRNKNVCLSEQKTSKVAAKITTFCFIGHSRPANEQRRNNSKNEQFQASPNKKQLRSSNGGISDLPQAKNKKMLDLSDALFRQTYGNGVLRSNEKPLVDRVSSTFYKTSPRKLINRLDQFKYRRLFIDEYRI